MLANALDFIKQYIDLLSDPLKGVGGSLTQKYRLQILFDAIESICKSPNPKEAFEEIKKSLEMTISLQKSEKHISH
jgi:hypothetical protein